MATSACVSPGRRHTSLLATVAASLLLGEVSSATPALTFSLNQGSNSYSFAINGQTWWTSAPPTICEGGKQNVLTMSGAVNTTGVDTIGSWSGMAVTWAASSSGTRMVTTFKSYAPSGSDNVVAITAVFPDGVDTSKCGSNSQASTTFPSFDSSSGLAPSLGYLSWSNYALKETITVKGMGNLIGGLDAGPVIAFTGGGASSSSALVWSTLDNHKIVLQQKGSGSYAMGLSAAIPAIPPGWNYSSLLVTSAGGPTAATYAWGAVLQRYWGTVRSPSVTLDKVGYYTDDGAYYYVWEAFNIPARPWPAEQGLVLVKEALLQSGVPIAYMQLDDWWYTGPFYFGNVKAVVDWHGDTSPRLFPNGLPAFSDNLDLPLQLYVPFWSDKFMTQYNMTESTVFGGTKLPTPSDSYAFFRDWFALGRNITNGRFTAFEIDFLESNFKGSASMFETVHSADEWYGGMAQAALEAGVVIQYCLPSATDILQSLRYPSVVQARASDDYVNTVLNPQEFGSSSLLMGALAVAPSKDTLWTTTFQPPTYSDTHQGGDYNYQPHVQLDAVLATLSLGPVGISDALNFTDVGLISQSFVSASNGTLLRPSRPLSWVDSVLTNRSLVPGGYWQDIRSTHAQVPSSSPSDPPCVTHYVVAWATNASVTLGPGDLYPAPPPGAPLAVRPHVIAPSGPGTQLAGCVDGQPAVPACVTLLPPGTAPVIPPTGGRGNISFVSLTSVYAPLPNGAYFLGELTKFVHVAPQRFAHVTATASAGTPCPGGSGASSGHAGLCVGVYGTAGQSVPLVAVDVSGTARVADVTIPAGGFVEVGL